MGGRDNRKLVSFRATDIELTEIERLVKASGLSKQEYLLGAALGNINTHTHFADSSIKPTISSGSMLIAEGDSSKSKTLKGIEAEKAILDGSLLQLKDKQKVLWFDGSLWIVSKSANGSQRVIERYVEYPLGLVQGLSKDHNERTLEEVIAALEFYNVILALGDVNDGMWQRGKEELWSIFYAPDSFKLEYLDQLELEAKKTLEALAAPTAVVDVVPSDEPIVSPSPYVEVPVMEIAPMQLTMTGVDIGITGVEFQARTGCRSSDYSKVCEVSSTTGWVDSDGNVWTSEGTKKNRLWFCCPVALAETETQVVSIV